MTLAAGQERDPVTAEVRPWLTHYALSEIGAWSLAGKVVLEWGAGLSTLWWARRCRRIFTVELNAAWAGSVTSFAHEAGLANVTVVRRPPHCSARAFTELPTSCTPDIVVIDGPRRVSCVAKTLTLRRPLTVIFDNWQQSGVFMSPEVESMMKPFVGVSYPDPEFIHLRRPWQTAIWHLT